MIGTLQFLGLVDLLLAGGVMVVFLTVKITVDRAERKKITLNRRD
jgi:hypothetical protein